jgi:hypothetical protein
MSHKILSIIFHQNGLNTVSARLIAPGDMSVDTGGEFAFEFATSVSVGFTPCRRATQAQVDYYVIQRAHGALHQLALRGRDSLVVHATHSATGVIEGNIAEMLHCTPVGYRPCAAASS